ncbi:kinase-like domain-containing protein [Tuber brumale]|nr:kinase-like domain-containing protein [Tuber brumale]
MAQSDLVEWYKLEAEFFQDTVRHTRYVEGAKNRNEKVKEEWRNCGKLGKGGFGIVHKQIQETTGCYRAVKTIDKRFPHKIDYSREILVMSILAKRPSLFVEFRGWFEEPETLYIAMEYLPEGDLTKHIGTPLPQDTVQNISKQILEGLKLMHQLGIAHRDLKPANIFVVRMSPVWVKLGDFGISKRILAQDTTTFHTQVSTQVYSAPEVLGLDSNSETSDYTNSVDIWSFGCVVYELLVGTRLFVSEGQLSRYYFGKFPFPKDKLKALSPPTDDIGISFLESMLVIQPEDRPTAASALRHEWLVGVKGDNEDCGDNQNETTQGRDERTRSDGGGSKLPTHPKRKESSEIDLITLGNANYTRGEVVLGVNPRSPRGSDPNIPKSAITTSVMTPPDVASIESSPDTGLWHSEMAPGNFPATRPKGAKCHGVLRKNRINNIPQTRPQDLPQVIPHHQNFPVELVFNRPLERMASWNTPQSANPPLPSTIKPLQELPAAKATLPSRTGSGRTIRKLQRRKSRKMSARIPKKGETVETKTWPPIQGKILASDENRLQGRTLLPDTILMLSGTLSRILILAAILMLAGILSGTLTLLGTPVSGEVKVSAGTPFLAQTQTTTTVAAYRSDQETIPATEEKVYRNPEVDRTSRRPAP